MYTSWETFTRGIVSPKKTRGLSLGLRAAIRFHWGSQPLSTSFSSVFAWLTHLSSTGAFFVERILKLVNQRRHETGLGVLIHAFIVHVLQHKRGTNLNNRRRRFIIAVEHPVGHLERYAQPHLVRFVQIPIEITVVVIPVPAERELLRI